MLDLVVNPSECWSMLPHFRSVPIGQASLYAYHARNVLDEQNPNTNYKLTSAGPTFYSAYATLDPTYDSGLGIYAPPYHKDHYTIRFLGPSYADSDPGGTLGYWVNRSRWYCFQIYGYTDIRTCDPPDEGLVSFTGEVWLIDTYFDYTAITWNNPPTYTGAKLSLSFAGYASLADHGMNWSRAFLIEVPRLESDNRPVPIYGYGCKISLVNDPTGAARCSFYVDMRGWHDDERVPYEFRVGKRVEPYYAAFGAAYYRGEYLPK